MFIETSSGWVNLDHVVEIASHTDGDERVYVLYTTDHADHRVRTELDDDPPFPVGSGRVVAAALGYHRLRIGLNDDGSVDVDRQPIVAWLIDGANEVVCGIAPDCWDIPGNGEAIEYPDGRVVELRSCGNWPDVATWASEEGDRQRKLAEWLAARRQAAEQKATLEPLTTA